MTGITVRKSFTMEEEIAHAVTHGLGVLVGIAALVLFAIKGAKTQNGHGDVSFVHSHSY